MVNFMGTAMATELSCFLLSDTIKTNDRLDKITLSVGLVLVQFQPTRNNQTSGYQTSLLNPGIEMLLTFEAGNNFDVSTGLNYQYGISKNNFIKERLIFEELSLPIIASIPIYLTKKRSLKLSSGFYIGQYVHIKKEVKSGKLDPGDTWQKISLENIEGYTKEKKIADIYFGLGYQEPNRLFQVSLFSRYRLNEIWINSEVSKLFYGIKINYFFKN